MSWWRRRRRGGDGAARTVASYAFLASGWEEVSPLPSLSVPMRQPSLDHTGLSVWCAWFDVGINAGTVEAIPDHLHQSLLLLMAAMVLQLLLAMGTRGTRAGIADADGACIAASEGGHWCTHAPVHEAHSPPELHGCSHFC